ncbi:MAG: hypothetical protein ACKOJH_00365 [Actinomycetota bacterium]
MFSSQSQDKSAFLCAQSQLKRPDGTIASDATPHLREQCVTSDKRFGYLIKRLCHRSDAPQDALQFGDHTAGNTNDIHRRRTEVVVPRSSSSPHFVVLQQVRVDEDAKLSRVAERGHAIIGLGNQTLYFRLIGRLFFISFSSNNILAWE